MEYIYFFSVILIYISQTKIYTNALKKKKNHAIIMQQKNKTYTTLDRTLKQVIVRLHSSAAYITQMGFVHSILFLI